MFPIEMKHIGKIEAGGTVQVFGYIRPPDPLTAARSNERSAVA